MDNNVSAGDGDNGYMFPAGIYYFSRFVSSTWRFWRQLGRLETRWLRKLLPPVDSPVYVCSLARSGTTITTELIEQHPDVTAHHLTDFPMMYLPYLWNRLMASVAKPETPQERIHRDGLMVTSASPEAMEEILWIKFFEHLHYASVCNVLDGKDRHRRFERFYVNHIRKLLLARNRKRYLSKGNCNSTRMEYISTIFPDARFIIPVRDPVSHIASMIKQDALFGELQASDPYLLPVMDMLGHHEFGHHRRPINVGDRDLIREIENAWDRREFARGWALYWNSIYDFIHQTLSRNPDLRRRCLIIRYEDLCERSGDTIDSILAHCELDPGAFAETRAQYIEKLQQPTYYQPQFTETEIATIREITGATAAKFGY